jgi:hypothetical protein
LPADYIKQQLDKFKESATRFTTKGGLMKNGLTRADGTTFVMPKGQADVLMKAFKDKPNELEKALGLPAGTLDSGDLLRVDIPVVKGGHSRSKQARTATALWQRGRSQSTMDSWWNFARRFDRSSYR